MKDYLKQASELVKVDDDDSDIKWAGLVMTKARQLKHKDWKEANTKIIEKSGLIFKWAGNETMLFREENKPKVDFYPSTGRWRVPNKKKTYRGGAKSFIKWYSKDL
jgi:hypothetical protein